MKTISKLGIMCALAGSVFLSSCASEAYIAERPSEPVYVRPVAPYANAYWVPGEWVWRGNRYVYRNGYYARPRARRVYVEGAWIHTNRGYVWKRGYWR
ncbi:YXWGXW repeat-containing protein [Mucilaginibacter psychrotolerans]|uniref:YXWGXW repeat-containing protein n=1 Tax=Mucilaginibacter psychrotolerans TaxID=1524096 RepID=A0A4Y8SCZ6_9SPHI|nr:YXWGXW repeat-containing protein [Mucilaginibacter psychrotolerans]TFF36772.1 hypothetical protein E2R66_14710 [Mucilaginibacter psychrotolerans]